MAQATGCGAGIAGGAAAAGAAGAGAAAGAAGGVEVEAASVVGFDDGLPAAATGVAAGAGSGVATGATVATVMTGSAGGFIATGLTGKAGALLAIVFGCVSTLVLVSAIAARTDRSTRAQAMMTRMGNPPGFG